ncbi:MAG: hypothetical protein ABIJ41_03900 [Candidatus Omnitrophota bacterium]
MLRKLRKRIKGQSTAEYAILIALVVAAVIAMQTFAKRALQARIKGASEYMVSNTGALGNTIQYEPYYLTSAGNIDRDQTQSTEYTETSSRTISTATITRGTGAFQKSAYNAEGGEIGTGYTYTAP